jgi:hypothetical protein
MRYLILSLWALLSFLLNGTVFLQVSIFGIQLDMILASLVVMTYLEKTLTPTFYMAGAAFLQDILFSKVLGFYTLQYVVIGLTLYLFVRNRRNHVVYAGIAGALSYILRDLLGLLLCLLIDVKKPFFLQIYRYALPGALLAALFTMLIYLIGTRIYRYRFMRPLLPDDLQQEEL